MFKPKKHNIYFVVFIQISIHVLALGESLLDDKYRQGLIGGTASSISKHPYLVSFRHKDEIVGAGAIIQRSWIITTANNVFLFEPKDLKVRASSDFATKGGQVIKIKNIFVHPENEGTWRNDIALVQLKEEIQLNKNAVIINIPDSLPRINDTMTTVCGWGYTSDDAKELTVLDDEYPILELRRCKKSFKKPDARGLSHWSFCTFKEGHIPCLFDDGAPLVNNKELIGVYSGTIECLDAKHPAVYVNLSLYKNWIYDTIKNVTAPLTAGS
ncbi:trypsin epsilon-like isoform X2 [Lycorma delicatula]|uniref:trypsin epsilon-like isoform X2 n=1 Tax=Lycorma delicatula TaxID=130591 RepID=UPI003F518AA3